MKYNDSDWYLPCIDHINIRVNSIVDLSCLDSSAPTRSKQMTNRRRGNYGLLSLMTGAFIVLFVHNKLICTAHNQYTVLLFTFVCEHNLVLNINLYFFFILSIAR